MEERQQSQTPSPPPTDQSTSNGSAAFHPQTLTSIQSDVPPPEPTPASQPEPTPVTQSEVVPKPLWKPAPIPVQQVSQPEGGPALYPNDPPQNNVEKVQPEPKSVFRAESNEVPKVTSAIPPEQVVTAAEKEKKRQNVLTRTIWTLIMIGGFIGKGVLALMVVSQEGLILFTGLLLLGHVYMIVLVMVCQTLVYREVTALFSLATTDTRIQGKGPLKAKDPWSKTLNWYFFAVTNYFLYGESIIYYFKVCRSLVLPTPALSLTLSVACSVC